MRRPAGTSRLHQRHRFRPFGPVARFAWSDPPAGHGARGAHAGPIITESNGVQFALIEFQRVQALLDAICIQPLPVSLQRYPRVPTMKKLPASQIPTERITLLAVDPIKEDYQSLLTILSSADWRVHWASSFREATTLMHESVPDLVLCEKDLPDGTWKDVFRAAEGRLVVPPLWWFPENQTSASGPKCSISARMTCF